MILTALDAPSLVRSLTRWEYSEYFACFLVALACFGEYVSEFTNWLTGDNDNRKRRLGKTSTLILIVALAFELICLAKTNLISRRLTGSLSDKATKADIKAQSALDKATGADTTAESAGTKASEAETKANAAGAQVNAVSRMAEQINMQLGMAEYLMSARRVRDPAALTNELRQFAGQSVTLKSYVGDVEGWGLCTQLWYIAHDAKMNAVNECGTAGLTSELIVPLTVFGPDVAESVKIGGLISRFGGLGASSGMRAPGLVIFVGAKPPFILGETAQTRDVERRAAAMKKKRSPRAKQ